MFIGKLFGIVFTFILCEPLVTKLCCISLKVLRASINLVCLRIRMRTVKTMNSNMVTHWRAQCLCTSSGGRGRHCIFYSVKKCDKNENFCIYLFSYDMLTTHPVKIRTFYDILLVVMATTPPDFPLKALKNH